MLFWCYAGRLDSKIQIRRDGNHGISRSCPESDDDSSFLDLEPRSGDVKNIGIADGTGRNRAVERLVITPRLGEKAPPRKGEWKD